MNLVRFIQAHSPRVLVALLFTLAAECVAAAPLVGATEDPRPPQESAADKIKARQALDASFKALEAELMAVIPEYSKALTEAQQKKIPREQWPKTPANDFYPRFEELALQDQPDALRWCLGVMGSLEMTIDLRTSKKDALYKRYVASSMDTSFTNDIIAFLSTDAAPDGIGVDRAAGFLDQISKGAAKNEVRSLAMWTKGQAYQRSHKPEHQELALATYKALVAAYPKSAEAERAQGIVFQLERLQVGMTAPDVTTTDLEGKEFKLSDSRGKVTLILFFNQRNRATMPMLTLAKEFVAGFKDKPFTMLGVSSDANKDELEKALADAGVGWKISWQDGPKSAWIKEWGIARMPALYVLDDQGVIRLVNPETAQLKKTLDSLFAEIEARKKAPK